MIAHLMQLHTTVSVEHDKNNSEGVPVGFALHPLSRLYKLTSTRYYQDNASPFNKVSKLSTIKPSHLASTDATFVLTPLGFEAQIFLVF